MQEDLWGVEVPSEIETTNPGAIVSATFTYLYDSELEATKAKKRLGSQAKIVRTAAKKRFQLPITKEVSTES